MLGGESLGIHATEARPEQLLACAVLRQALTDAISQRSDKREAARGFLLGQSADLGFWCAVAGLPVTAVRECARKQLPGPRGVSNQRTVLGLADS